MIVETALARFRICTTAAVQYHFLLATRLRAHLDLLFDIATVFL